MGARVKVKVLPAPEELGRQWNGVRRSPSDRTVVRLDVRGDARGEYFELVHRRDVAVDVLEVNSAERHLLLMARQPLGGGQRSIESRFLCGHDERAWFVAAIPEEAEARDVQAAKDALKPQAVWDAIREFGVPMDQRDRRRTAAFVRQGEWFFIPRYDLKVDETRVLEDEPIRRGAGKPHVCQYLFRIGGDDVFVSDEEPNGITVAQYRQLPREQRRSGTWRRMTRDAIAYVKGSVRHPDHKTIWLSPWHEVVMNTETKALAMQNVAFLD